MFTLSVEKIVDIFRGPGFREIFSSLGRKETGYEDTVRTSDAME